MDPNGILLIDKPSGITSFQALSPIKRKLGVKVGHTGTLDRFASGLLVVLAGSMTRMNPLFTGFDKVYEAVFTFGKTTTTLDPEGEVTDEGPVPGREEVLSVLSRFTGKQKQVPPKFSAVHVGGRRAYQAALGGEEVELAPRDIIIYELNAISYEAPELTLIISCSKGTYVRALARDIAASLGTYAYVSQLKRSAVGGFRLEGAVSPEEFSAADIVNPWEVFDTLGGISKVVIAPSRVSSILCGTLPKDDWIIERHPVEGSSLCALFTEERDLLAVSHCSISGDTVSYKSYKFVVSAGNR